ncbi:hypothetical protein [Echinimonas agarilytica]|uniref:Outer membrane protein beta-barrel domain-containing protein n=1 Tax=Echinimonas agarilytica TaxID=1215918 RepID=A0AA41W4E9_9GAMM|nr:hypothetical protein [Echinimonas agarilytica]MCM2678434.1 hypothetical protein [Echinimonas agarilytica]
MNIKPLLLMGLIWTFSSSAFAIYDVDGLSVRVGGYWANVDSKMKLRTAQGNIDEVLDFEHHLNLEESSGEIFIEAAYRRGHHLFIGNFYQLNRRGYQPEMTRDFEFEHNDDYYRVTVGAALETQLDIDIYQLAYGYEFYKAENVAAGASVGLHILDITTAFQGELLTIVNGQEQEFADELIDHDLTAPLPNVGLYGHYRLPYDVTVGLRSQYLKVTVDEYTGFLLEARLSAFKHITEHFSAGVAYQYFAVEYDDENRVRKWDVDLTYHGPMLLVGYEF